MELIVSPKIKNKLKNKHKVTIEEVHQCISNIQGELIEDTAEIHQTIPPSFWFVAQTDYGRELKVVLVSKGDKIFFKTAFDAKIAHIQLYKSLNKA